MVYFRASFRALEADDGSADDGVSGGAAVSSMVSVSKMGERTFDGSLETKDCKDNNRYSLYNDRSATLYLCEMV